MGGRAHPTTARPRRRRRPDDRHRAALARAPAADLDVGHAGAAAAVHVRHRPAVARSPTRRVRSLRAGVGRRPRRRAHRCRSAPVACSPRAGRHGRWCSASGWRRWPPPWPSSPPGAGGTPDVGPAEPGIDEEIASALADLDALDGDPDHRRVVDPLLRPDGTGAGSQRHPASGIGDPAGVPSPSAHPSRSRSGPRPAPHRPLRAGPVQHPPGRPRHAGRRLAGAPCGARRAPHASARDDRAPRTVASAAARRLGRLRPIARSSPRSRSLWRRRSCRGPEPRVEWARCGDHRRRGAHHRVPATHRSRRGRSAAGAVHPHAPRAARTGRHGNPGSRHRAHGPAGDGHRRRRPSPAPAGAVRPGRRVVAGHPRHRPAPSRRRRGSCRASSGTSPARTDPVPRTLTPPDRPPTRSTAIIEHLERLP